MLILEDHAGRTSHFRQVYPDAVITEHASEAIRILQEQQFSTVSLDHDLNGEAFVDSSRADCGMEVVRWIVANKPAIKRIIIHTANRGASERMYSALVEAGYNASLEPFGGQYDSRG